MIWGSGAAILDVIFEIPPPYLLNPFLLTSPLKGEEYNDFPSLQLEPDNDFPPLQGEGKGGGGGGVN